MTIIEFNTNKKIEISSTKELKELLMYSNPIMFNFYKNQLKKEKPYYKLVNMGTGLKIYDLRIKENKPNVQ